MEFLEEMRDIANEYSRDDDQERSENVQNEELEFE